MREKSLNCLLKTSNYGFLEAIIEGVTKYEPEEDDPLCDIKQFDIGQVTVDDVELALQDKLAIINFDQPIRPAVAQLIKSKAEISGLTVKLPLISCVKQASRRFSFHISD